MKYLAIILSTVFIHASIPYCGSLDSSRFAIKSTAVAKKGPNMISTKLPFDLSETDLSKIEMTYLYHSQKTNAGFQEIGLSGNGQLHLNKTLSIDEKPELIESKVGKKEIIAILSLMEEENFLGLEDVYPPKSTPHGYRKLTLKLPSRTKTVMLCEPLSPEFERIVGAIKVVAGIALPQALGHAFFPNL